MGNQKHHRWLMSAVFLLMGSSLQIHSQVVDDLQEYLDSLAAEQPVRKAQTRGDNETVVIPIGLTEVDLSKFSSYQNRTEELTIKVNVKFINGSITAQSDFNGTSLLKVYNGATVVIDETSGANASAASSTNCLQAVGIYGSSTFYQCGDITAPDNGTGVAVYLDTAGDAYHYISGQTTGSISNPNNGTVTGIGDPLKDKVEELQNRLTQFEADVNTQQQNVIALQNRLSSIENAIGSGFFQRIATDAFSSGQTATTEKLSGIQNNIATLITNYNSLINVSAITTMEEANEFEANLQALESSLGTATSGLEELDDDVTVLETDFAELSVVFPDEETAYALVPDNGVASNAIQLGYKSNRGFVLTSSGMMYFEHVEGATFRLHDQSNNYVVVNADGTLKGGTQDEATVWTGICAATGKYRFCLGVDQLMTCGGNTVNADAKAINKVNGDMLWTITESNLDDLQAFLNLLAEEEEEEDNGGNSDLTEDDVLSIEVPTVLVTCDGCNSTPWVFPKLQRPIRIYNPDGGHRPWPIPIPEAGKPRPVDFHPIEIPKGSHVIFDNVDFDDLIGGGHVVYVQGILEININVIVNIENWDWFIHVGPGGQVIWRPGRGDNPNWQPPRLKVDDGGKVDVKDDGYIGYIENSGNVTQTTGTIEHVFNKNIYHFNGGIVNFMDNHGTVTQEGGSLLRGNNEEGCTYNMKGGQIINTEVNITETVFVNCGSFFFTGGIIGGYGSRLIYHGPKGIMRIDGGIFDFTHVKDYFIEAWSDFYIRGDYDYKPTVPILLNPQVSIRILYKWIYKFNVTFIGGSPKPRYPLFYGPEGVRIDRTYIQYIDWTLPNKRWHWVVNDNANSIEPRDEAVEDEDDLQAYLDWLAENQDGESASTAEDPQELDLKSHEIVITKYINVPIGAHVRFKNGTFKPGVVWTDENVFHIPATSSVTLETVTFDFSKRTYYVENNVVVQRYLFDVDGDLYFGPNCHIVGWLDTSLKATDNMIPGAVIRIAPEGRIYLNGGRFENVVFRLNTEINLFVSVSLSYRIYVYLPETCRTKGFRLAAPIEDFHFELNDLKRIWVFSDNDWLMRTDDEGYVCLFDNVRLGDANIDKTVDVSDVVACVNYILGKPSDNFYFNAANVNFDETIDVADVVGIVNIILGKAYVRGMKTIETDEETTNDDRPSLSYQENGTLSLCMENLGNYVAAQFDVRLAAGQQLEGINLNSECANGHSLSYSQIGPNLWRVLVYSIYGDTFSGHDSELLNIRTTGHVMVEQISFVTTDMVKRQFELLDSQTTAITNQSVTPSAADVYSLDGRLVKKSLTSLQSLPHGVYIHKGRKVVK